MRKPISEHSTKIKAGKGRPASQEPRIEYVAGGRVRRVEFREEPEAPPAPTPRQPSDDSLDQIHFEVDNLDRIRRGAPARARRPRERIATRKVYETDRGGVNERRLETTRGERRVLYTARRRGAREEEQRFHSGLVDRIIADKYDAGPKFEAVSDDAPKRRLGFGKKAKKPAKPKVEEPEYQPQCEAITRDGVQCRNSAKDGSEYCGSHQTYAPRSLEEVLDTQPTRGDDTLPGEGDKSGTGQCAAYTKDGMQCKRSSRKNSKYCATHKGYRAPSKQSLSKRLDTEPRHKGAKDTPPKLR